MLVIEDVSHPDRVAQKETVLKTLKGLRLNQSLIDSLIFVGNKVDKADGLPNEPDTHFISCLSGYGLPELIATIDKVF